MRNLVLIVPIVLFGCGARTTPGETTAGTGGGTGGDTDGGSGGGMTSTSGAGSASDGESGGVSSDSGPVTTSGGGTGGDPEPELVEACKLACDKFMECYPDEFPAGECVDECLAGSPGGPECTEAWVNLYECYASATCAEIDNGEVCWDQEDAIPEECWGGGGEVCSVGVGGNELGTECSMIEMCPDSTREISCEPAGCLCIENGDVVAECPAMEVCAEPGLVEELFFDCCGF